MENKHTWEEVNLKQHLLANFCDGDSWEEADAVSFSKNGALEIAKYFFELNRQEIDLAVLKD